MQKPVTTKIVIVKVAKKSGKYPVKLRVTFNREQRFYPCNKDLSQEEFTKIFNSAKPRKSEKDFKDVATAIEVKAQGIIAGMKIFDFTEFENKLYERKSGDGDLYDLFKKYYNELMSADRIGNAIMYNTVLNSLKKFRPKITFAEITVGFLNKYENWLVTNTDLTGKSNARSLTTVGIYMRHLRAVYNRGIFENMAEKENYPFGKNKYIIPTGNNIKKALTIDEIGLIYNYETLDNGWECKARDFWCFSYLCNGMNIMDIAKLKYKNISGGEIHYERTKTVRSNRGKSASLISIPIFDKTQQVIDTWGNKKSSDEIYIFPILKEEMTSLQVKKTVQQFTKNMNKYTNRIAIHLGINKNLTTYVARHSYASVLKRSGASTEMISEGMGHKDLSTTKNYLASFEADSRKKNAQALIAFDK